MPSRLDIPAAVAFAIALSVALSSQPAVAASADTLSRDVVLQAEAGSAPDQDAHADIPEDAGRFLEALGQRAVAELTDGTVDEAERERRFRAMFRESFDLGAISRFVLGKYWRRASQKQQDAFLDIFEDAVVQRFLPLFKDYSGESFTVGRLRRDENNPSHVFVTTTITQANGEPVTVEWRLKEKVATRTYRILDVHAEGVSMAITLRQEYASVVRQSGLDHLLDQLRKKIQAGDFAPPAE